MSEYTREEILKLIEDNGGPLALDLSGKDLTDIDLSKEAIAAELEKAGERALDETPVWYNQWRVGIKGINLRGANLQEAKLRGANLQGATLAYANLQGAYLTGADLQGAYLGRANLQGAHLRGANLQEADLWFANLQGAYLASADLQGASLSQAKLQGANLGSANLQGADLWRANLQGAILTKSHLEKVDLFSADSLEGAYFCNAFLDDTRIRREQIGVRIGEEESRRNYNKAKEAYLALKDNFAEIGRYEDAAWAYRKERRMEKATKAPWRARVLGYHGGDLPFPSQIREAWEKLDRWGMKPPSAYYWLPRSSTLVWWFWFKYTLKWLADWFVELLCDYGESIWRVLAWMLLAILGFAAYYQVSRAVVTSSQDAATSLWDHLIFSLGAFTTLQPARLQAARPGVELLTTFQAIIGISLAGLLGFVAGNRIRRS